MAEQFLAAHPEHAALQFEAALRLMHASQSTIERFSTAIRALSLGEAVAQLSAFASISIKLVQAFYRVRAAEITPILKRHGFKLLRITSRGTEIYPTMCDFEKRDVDRYRVEIDEQGILADAGFDHARIQVAILAAQMDLASAGWILSETMLNRTFIDGEGDKLGKLVAGVSKPYGMNLGTDYSAG